MDTFKQQTIITALKDMFQGTYFNICTIDKCLKIANAIPRATDYDCLSALHCVHWKNMPSELREEVYNRTLAMFSQSSFDFSILDMIFNEKNQQFETNEPKRKVLSFLNK